jgi:hypothetical protein
VLSGSLDSVSLAGLLQLLSAEGRSGRLALEAGSLWLEDGAVVHAECGEAAGEEAVFGLVASRRGDFRFEEGERPPARTVSAPTELLVLQAACRRDHGRRDAGLDVEPAAVPRFAAVRGGSATPRFDTLQWKVLAAIDGRRNVEQLAGDLGLPLPAVAGVVAGLVGAGALELD